jgi:hypothetical protein
LLGISGERHAGLADDQTFESASIIAAGKALSGEKALAAMKASSILGRTYSTALNHGQREGFAIQLPPVRDFDRGIFNQLKGVVGGGV